MLIRRPERELVQIRLADDDHAGVAQVTDDGCVGARDVAFTYARSRGGRNPLDIDQVLDGDRNAMQDTAVAPLRELTVALGGVAPRLVRPSRG